MQILYSETRSFIRRLLPVWWQRLAAIAGFWLIVTLFSTAHWQLLLANVDPWSEGELIRVKLQVWTVWALLTPMILAVGYRLRFGGTVRPVINLAGLVALSVVVTAGYVFAYTGILYINFSYPREGSFQNLLHFVLTRHSSYYYLAFWVIIGVEQLLIAYQRWHEREMQASQLQAQLAQAQLQALRSQVKPHFLFNVLNTISSTILEGEREKAHHLTTRLSELLRKVLDRDHQEMGTLASEFEFNRLYLELMSERFEPRLTFDIHAPVDCLNASVPELLLQPLVENAVIHGVASHTGESSVVLMASKDHQRLIITIEERGERTGMAERVSSNGLGHRITEERLRQIYASNFKFIVEPRSNSGMRVTLDLPYQQTSES